MMKRRRIFREDTTNQHVESLDGTSEGVITTTKSAIVESQKTTVDGVKAAHGRHADSNDLALREALMIIQDTDCESKNLAVDKIATHRDKHDIELEKIKKTDDGVNDRYEGLLMGEHNAEKAHKVKEDDQQQNKATQTRAIALAGGDDLLSDIGSVNLSCVFQAEKTGANADFYITISGPGRWSDEKRKTWIRLTLEKYEASLKASGSGEALTGDMSGIFTTN